MNMLLLVLLPRIRGPAEQQLPWIRLGGSQVPQLAIRHFSRVSGLPSSTGPLGRPTEPPSLSRTGPGTTRDAIRSVGTGESRCLAEGMTLQPAVASPLDRPDVVVSQGGASHDRSAAIPRRPGRASNDRRSRPSAPL